MDVAGGPIVPVAADLGPWPEWMPAAAARDLGALDHGYDELIQFESPWGANLGARRELFATLGLWDVTVGRRGDERSAFEDLELQNRVRAAGGTVRFCRDAVIRHRVPPGLVDPWRVLTMAFARGRDDHLRATQRGDQRSASSLAALVACGRWWMWSTLFGVARHREVLARAHRAAWETGIAMQRAQLGRRRRLTDRAILNAIRYVRSRTEAPNSSR